MLSCSSQLLTLTFCLTPLADSWPWTVRSSLGRLPSSAGVPAPSSLSSPHGHLVKTGLWWNRSQWTSLSGTPESRLLSTWSRRHHNNFSAVCLLSLAYGPFLCLQAAPSGWVLTVPPPSTFKEPCDYTGPIRVIPILLSPSESISTLPILKSANQQP